MSSAARVALHSVIVGVGVGLSSLASSAYGSGLELGEILLALSLAWGGGAGYAGLNYGSKTVNPDVGKG